MLELLRLFWTPLAQVGRLGADVGAAVGEGVNAGDG